MADITSKLLRWIFCFSGILPMRIVVDEDEGRLRSLVFCVSHPETWWYLLLFTTQFSAWLLMFNNYWNYLFNQLTTVGENASVSILVCGAILIVPLVMQFIARLALLLKASELNELLKLIEEYDRRLTSIMKESSNARRIVFIGFTVFTPMIFVTGYHFFTDQKGFNAAFPNSYSTFSRYCIIILELFGIFQLCTLFNLLYASYYSIAFRFKQLSTYLQTDEALKTRHDINNCGKNVPSISNIFNQSQQKTSKPLEKLKTAHLLFDELVQISQKLNSTFSIQILLYLVFSFVVVTTHLFFAITDATNANIALAALLFFVGFIFIILTAADLPVEEVSNLREVVSSISKHCENTNQRLQIITFEMVLKEDRVRVSAAGLFNVGIDLFPSIIGSVATYLIILLQTLSEN